MGPYHVVRHPIYSGLLLALLGTSLATDVYWLIVLAVAGAYFVYTATVEERPYCLVPGHLPEL